MIALAPALTEAQGRRRDAAAAVCRMHTERLLRKEPFADAAGAPHGRHGARGAEGVTPRPFGAPPVRAEVSKPRQSFSVSPAFGCHFIKRFSTAPTTASSASANAVSTRMPAITVLMS